MYEVARMLHNEFNIWCYNTLWNVVPSYVLETRGKMLTVHWTEGFEKVVRPAPVLSILYEVARTLHNELNIWCYDTLWNAAPYAF